ncbi:hypothetical protein [Sphingomonas sp.]|jgi:hypothetical protein|uniref:hypothetical protein n=1 Tax=Sphingomonas sp. TaxID=28214 RepID=UPI002DF6AE2E|nr:hypothetical protein [Sphingomonas sp.]
MTEAASNLGRLHEASSAAVHATLESGVAAEIGEAYAFVTELEAWREPLADQPEVVLFDTAHGEYLIALLNAVQGQYRNAFKGLRLVLELHLQGVLLSTDLLALKEWLGSGRHTIWARVVDDDGVFGNRMINAFFATFRVPAARMRDSAKTTYSELSECIHGNVPVAIPLPEAICFHEPSVRLWLEKARSVRRLTHFAFMLRYIGDIDEAARHRLEPALVDVLGDIVEVRSFFGGRTE